MKTRIIQDCWQGLADHQEAITAMFYSRFLERFPQYEHFFTAESIEMQKKKMVQTVALISQLADDPSVISPRMQSLGEAHQKFNLHQEDLERFSNTLVEVIAEYGEKYYPQWSQDCELAWRQAFDEVVKPKMLAGLA